MLSKHSTAGPPPHPFGRLHHALALPLKCWDYRHVLLCLGFHWELKTLKFASFMYLELVKASKTKSNHKNKEQNLF